MNNKRLSKRLQSRQFYWVVFGMVALIVFVLVLVFVKDSSYKFEYKTLSFTIEKSDDLLLYHYYYYFNKGGQTYQTNVYLRNDPRKNNVPVDIKTYYPENVGVIIAINETGTVGCEDSSLAVATLTQFYGNNLMKVRGATVDKEQAKANNMTFANCTSNPSMPVILFEGANVTQIRQPEKNCYVIDVANCEILPAVEKFIVQSILYAKNN